MTEELCGWCKHADKCERKKSLQKRTVLKGGMGGMIEVAHIEEVVVSCKEYECLFPKKEVEG